MADESLTLRVRRDDWQKCEAVSSPLPELDAGQVLFRVDRFAITSNNISYALTGDMLHYWDFFPDDEGWGRIPVMGFADVVASNHSEVPSGDRVFGFFPMGTHLVIQADHVSEGLYVDAAPHRSQTAPVYRQYTRSQADPLYRPEHEDSVMVLRGLFFTSFLVDDFFADNEFFGARDFVITSASSKTAIALAYQLHQRGHDRVIGLTSPGNRAFVEGLGYYDEVIAYDEIPSLSSDVPAVLVDHAGDGKVMETLHRHYGDQLKYSCIVGATHWDAGQREANLPGAEPSFFFAPGQSQKRAQDWGALGLQERLGGAWQKFRAASEAWLLIVRGVGPAEVERVYRTILAGRARPHEGHVLSMWE